MTFFTGSNIGLFSLELCQFAYQQAHTLDDLHLAQLLQCNVADLVHLRLCQLPRTDHFDQDLARIAEHVHADAAILAQVLTWKETWEGLGKL